MKSIGERSVPKRAALFAAAALIIAACGGGETATPAAPAPAPAAPAPAAPAAPTFALPASVDIVTHSGPGAGGDVFARTLAQMWFEGGFTRNIWPVQNVEGGSGAQAMAFLTQEQGNDELLASFTMTWVATTITSDGAVDVRNMTPIAQVLVEPTFIAARINAPFDDFDEMIAWSQANQGQLNVAGGSVTSHAALVAGMIQQATGTTWRFISFPGGERLASVLSGDTDIMFGSVGDFSQQVAAGTMKWIASIEAERANFLPDVPTMLELGYDVEVLEQVRGILGPPGMSPEAVAAYEQMIRDFTETTVWRDYVADNGWTPSFAGSEQFGRTIAALQDRLTDLLAAIQN